MPNKESILIKAIAGDFARHPKQLNKLLEAYAEIMSLPGRDNEWLVLKTDGLHEEIKTRLYEDPYLLGWMTVTAPVSDIAAVGAIPTGILLSLVLDQDIDSKWLAEFKSGINAACDKYNIYVLGGDTNFDVICSVSATVVANISGRKPLLRTGMNAGDILYASGLPGLGNAFGYSKMFDPSFQVTYKPVARLDASHFIGKYATACIDTSDGLFPALAVLCELNGTGCNLTVPLETILNADAAAICSNAKIPAWMLLAGPHGEYELLFTIPAKLRQIFERDCADGNFGAVMLGEITGHQQISFVSGSMQVSCESNVIPDLYYESRGNVATYYSLLQQQHDRWNNL
ncbi:MAG: thiamine-phosphate kinase [Bacteroidota bacterium]